MRQTTYRCDPKNMIFGGKILERPYEEYLKMLLFELEKKEKNTTKTHPNSLKLFTLSLTHVIFSSPFSPNAASSLSLSLTFVLPWSQQVGAISSNNKASSSKVRCSWWIHHVPPSLSSIVQAFFPPLGCHFRFSYEPPLIIGFPSKCSTIDVMGKGFPPLIQVPSPSPSFSSSHGANKWVQSPPTTKLPHQRYCG